MLNTLLSFLGTQAIEAILGVLHRDDTDAHQEAEVHPGFPSEFLPIVFFYFLFFVNVSSYVQKLHSASISFLFMISLSSWFSLLFHLRL